MPRDRSFRRWLSCITFLAIDRYTLSKWYRERDGYTCAGTRFCFWVNDSEEASRGKLKGSSKESSKEGMSPSDTQFELCVIDRKSLRVSANERKRSHLLPLRLFSSSCLCDNFLSLLGLLFSSVFRTSSFMELFMREFAKCVFLRDCSRLHNESHETSRVTEEQNPLIVPLVF